MDMVPVQEDIKNKLKSYSNLVAKSAINSLKIDNARAKIAYLENESADTRRQCNTAETTLNQIKETYNNVKGQAKAVLQKAKGMSNGYTPDDRGFDEFRTNYDTLSCDLKELQIEKDQLLARIDCLNTADNNELREFEERLRLIEQLQNEIEQSHGELNQFATNMERLEQEWLVPLRQLIDEINLRFAAAFERMGCAGEVSLSTGINVKEYSEYGLCIKVTYRNGEQLQELNNVVQSGGERAVATAAFMLALQEITPVPFRCVDEINQGMDANNERRIFELIVDATSQLNTAQYFLITPKVCFFFFEKFFFGFLIIIFLIACTKIEIFPHNDDTYCA